MADPSTHERAVLETALQLGSFSVSQLVADSGVGYDVVKRTLANDAGRTIRPTGEWTTTVVGAPAEIWAVGDRAAVERRLHDLGAHKASPRAVRDDDVELRLEAAEDRVVMGLHASAAEDASALAREALGQLAGTELEHSSRPEPGPRDAPLVIHRLQPSAHGRSWIVGALSNYLLAHDETAGLSGTQWREAFRALAAVDLPEHAALHRRMLVDLVRVADERAQRGVYGMPKGEFARLLERVGADPEEIAGRVEPESRIVRAAVAKLLRELGRGHRSAEDEVIARLCRLGGELFALGTYAPEDDTELAVSGLRDLALRDEPRVADRARRALLAIGRPHDAAFWRDLASASRPAPLGLIFAGLSRFSLEEAFSYMRDAICEEHAIVEARISLMEALPALDRQAPYVVQHHFAEFLATLKHDDRSYLMAAPTLAGLKWSPPPLDRALANRFLSTLQLWATLLDGAHEDARVLQELAAIGKQVEELAAEAFHTLASTEQRRAVELLTAKVHERGGAAVCVPVLVSAGLESELALALVWRRRYREPRSLVSWYLEVAPRARLRRAHDKALVKALHEASSRGLPFLAILKERAAREGIEVPELDWVPGLEVKAQFLVETEEYEASKDALAQINDELLQMAGGDVA